MNFLQIDKGSKPEKKFFGGRGGGLGGIKCNFDKESKSAKTKKSLGGGMGRGGGGVAWGLGRVCECF